MNLTIERTTAPKMRPADESKLHFGECFTDHMFLMDWTPDKGWQGAKIVPFAPIMMSPAATCLHYGQEIFEGMKAYRLPNGEISLFRPDQNFKRMNRSAERLSMPTFDEKFLLESLLQLVRIDADWVPTAEGASLYIRPFMIGVEPALGANPATQYKFLMILSPSGHYYPNGLAPVNIHVETEYIRAAGMGGLGEAKTGGNYAASFQAQRLASERGYDQVLWLDSVTRKNIEEVGSMNVFFVLCKHPTAGSEKERYQVITPALSGSILPGITRKSCVQILRDVGYDVVERTISIDEIVEAHQQGALIEAFGTGTAAVIAPIGGLHYRDAMMQINNGEIGEVSRKLFDTLTKIQFGQEQDLYHWMVSVPHA